MRPRYYILLIALALGAVIVWQMRFSEDRWRTLPGGGEIKLLAVTYSDVHILQQKRRLFAMLSELIRERTIHPSAMIGYRVSSSRPDPSLILWFLTRDIPSPTLSGMRADIFLSGGQSIPGLGPDTNWTDDESRYTGFEFNIGDLRDPHLHIQLQANGQTYDLHIKNPAHGKPLPTPSPAAPVQSPSGL